MKMSEIMLAPALVLVTINVSKAEDTRKVTRPVYPETCQVLNADDGLKTDTIQQALNSCSKNHAVKLLSSSKRAVVVSGPLTLPSAVSLWIDRGVVLTAINNAAAFDKGKKVCGTLSDKSNGCQAFITAENTVNSGIYGQGVIDGQGGEPLTDKHISWWQLAQQAKQKSKKQSAPRLIQINKSKNFTLYDITLINSPNFHVVFNQSNGLTAWNSRINTPATARNTDGIDPISSQNITITHSYISTGDDNVAIKANADKGITKNISIIDNIFAHGHGMSIGSETSGVYNVLVKNLIIHGAENGLRIKSDPARAGIVNNISYCNIFMDNVKNPIVIDTVYENKSGSNKAQWTNLNYDNIRSKGEGNVILNGTNARQKIVLNMHNVDLDSATHYQDDDVEINRN